MASNLEDLFKLARQYGRPRLYTMDDGHYHCCIEFNTTKHVKLEAKSDFKQPTPEDAVSVAIASAKTIVESVNRLAICQS